MGFKWYLFRKKLLAKAAAIASNKSIYKMLATWAYEPSLPYLYHLEIAP